MSGPDASASLDAAVDPPADALVEAPLHSWCDPATWGGEVPSERSDVTIRAGQVVLMDCEGSARTLEIAPGGTLVASRTRSSRLTMHGNLVVRGRMDYGQPGDRVRAGVLAEVVFTGMHDEDYVGSPGIAGTAAVDTSIVASDVGLWVTDDGVVTAAGQLKRAWSRLTEGAGPSDTSASVDDASGWLAGDRVMLTPTERTSVPGYSEHFDETTLADVRGNTVTLAAAPRFPHAGCADGCVRRGELANLTRNVVIRSADDTAHAHIMVHRRGVMQLDSVELRWLGPEYPGGPDRRSALFFHRQDQASRDSYVRHCAIWGGQHGFVEMEQSSGIELTDTVGYDTAANALFGGFSLVGCDHSECAGPGDLPRPGLGVPRDVLFTEVLAARIIPNQRSGDGARIGYLVHGFACGGDVGTGCVRCVAAGINGPDSTGYLWSNNLHLPVGEDQAFRDNVSHNNSDNGLRLWQNSGVRTPPWERTQAWSNGEGIFEGAYVNGYQFGDLYIEDSRGRDAALQAVPGATDTSLMITRLEGATLGQIVITGYVLPQINNQTFRGIRFNGAHRDAVTQDHSACREGDQDNPSDHNCIRNWALFENNHFPVGVRPFDFGWHGNRHTTWQVRGFASDDPAYRDLPRDFDLYRRDNEVTGGRYYAPFDAWLVPR